MEKTTDIDITGMAASEIGIALRERFCEGIEQSVRSLIAEGFTLDQIEIVEYRPTVDGTKIGIKAEIVGHRDWPR